jgi:hypothetical protein
MNRRAFLTTGSMAAVGFSVLAGGVLRLIT